MELDRISRTHKVPTLKKLVGFDLQKRDPKPCLDDQNASPK
jgi:hypothetical protein